MSKERVHEILEVARDGDRASRWFDIFIITLISLNIVALILESLRPLHERWSGYFAGFEAFSVTVFTVEYVLRLWSATADVRYQGALRGRLRLARTPLAIVDLLAILPAFISVVGFDLRFLRALRLFRLLRVAKLYRYSESLRLLGSVVRRKREDLIVALAIVALLLLLASSMIYFVEREAQPDQFTSIPAAMWWGIVTLTTVGYGDMTPVTPLGRLLGSFVAILGIGMVALPTGILAAGFMEALQERRQPFRCPHCGEEIP